MRYTVRTPFGTFTTRDKRAASAIVRALGGTVNTRRVEVQA